MSYEIVYAKKFIKLSNGVILPLILSGSNNCTMFSYETGKEILERHWWLFTGFLDKTGDELIAWAEERVNGGEKNSEWFKENSKWVTNETFVRWMKNCVKKASTIEEILEANPFVHLSAFLSVLDSSKSWGEKGYERRENYKHSLKTTEEIEKWIKEAKEREKEWGEKGKVYYNFEFSTIKPLKSVSVSKSIFGPVICCVRRGQYLTEYNENSYGYCGDVKKALVFENAEVFKATDLPQRIHGYKLISAKVKEKERRFYIEVTEGSHAGWFVKKLTSRNLHFTRCSNDARRFEKESEAQRYIEERLKGRFLGAKEFAVNYSAIEREEM